MTILADSEHSTVQETPQVVQPCKWGEHKYRDSGKDNRGWTRVNCAECGKFFGYRPPDVRPPANGYEGY